jgi:hypothetical protein
VKRKQATTRIYQRSEALESRGGGSTHFLEGSIRLRWRNNTDSDPSMLDEKQMRNSLSTYGARTVSTADDKALRTGSHPLVCSA